jgi:glycosyltransferase involved in cell wall biosynthesis
MRRILCPDPEVLWVPFATRRALTIVKRYNIDSVIVTAPPFSAFLIGNALKRKLPHIQLISDFRDEWLRFFLSTFSFHKNDAIKRRAEAIERATVELSDTVISITGRVVDELRERYHEQSGRKFVHIPNGYDPQIFKDFHSRPHDLSRVVVSYIGTVYSTTSPKSYLEALATLPDDIRSRIETRFIGRIADDQRELLESDSSLKLLGYMKQGEALKLMEETDFLLVVMQDPTFATGKIYEYLASGKPIVALSPDGGEVAKTIEETGAGWCIDPANISEIAGLLRKLATGELRDTGSRNEEAIRGYERPRLAAKFAAVMSSDTTSLEKHNVPEVASAEAGV